MSGPWRPESQLSFFDIALSNFIQRLVQVPHDVELIIVNGGLGSFLAGNVLEGLPPSMTASLILADLAALSSL